MIQWEKRRDEYREELTKKLQGQTFETEEDTGVMHTEAFM